VRFKEIAGKTKETPYQRASREFYSMSPRSVREKRGVTRKRAQAKRQQKRFSFQSDGGEGMSSSWRTFRNWEADSFGRDELVLRLLPLSGSDGWGGGKSRFRGRGGYCCDKKS